MRRFVRHIFLALLVVSGATTVTAGGKSEAGALIEPAKALEMVQAGDAVLLDVRSEAEYVTSHIAGAINIPLSQVAAQADRFENDDRTVITYCACPAEETSQAAADALVQAGITNVMVLRGGIREWAALQYPLKAGARP